MEVLIAVYLKLNRRVRAGSGTLKIKLNTDISALISGALQHSVQKISGKDRSSSHV
jgi:hypothetical protein